MEVTMEVCDGSGKALLESLSSGESVACNEEARQSQNLSSSGLEQVYRTCVLYHVGKIEWNEVVKVSVNTEDLSGCHLRFTFRHMGRNDVKERPKPIALAFIKLVNIFDLKGSKVARNVKIKPETKPSATLKDLNFLKI